MSPIISPKELADAIGVSESSLKRWADGGLIRVTRTVGGHRRIAIGEAIRFIRSMRAPLLRPEAIGMSDLAGHANQAYSTEDPTEQLFTFLRDGRADEAWGLIASLYLSGRSVAEIGDGPIRIAMQRLGDLWQHDDAGIFIEHRATAICCHVVERLRSLLSPPGADFCAVGGGVAGDPYLLASLLSATALTAEGIAATSLGPDTPFNSLRAAYEEYRPKLMWLSISSVRNERELEDGIASLAKHLAGSDCLLVLGGREIGRLLTPDTPNIRRGSSLSELVSIATKLREAPTTASTT